MATSNAALKTAYLRVADRAIDAADMLVGEGVKEYSAFDGYHAFESLGGAVAAHFGHNIPVGHSGKINVFTQLSATFGRRFESRIAVMAIELSSIRNLMLYPEELPNDHIALPENRMTRAAANRITGRVRSLIVAIKTQI